MAFKSGQQRKFLYALDKDKQKGIGSPAPQTSMPAQKSAPMSIPTSRPPQMTQPPHAFKLGAPAAPQFHPPVGSSIKPTSIPSLPGMPKFQKLKNYFKKPRGM